MMMMNFTFDSPTAFTARRKHEVFWQVNARDLCFIRLYQSVSQQKRSFCLFCVLFVVVFVFLLFAFIVNISNAFISAVRERFQSVVRWPWCTSTPVVWRGTHTSLERTGSDRKTRLQSCREARDRETDGQTDGRTDRSVA